jgi:uncharacterized protein YqjF (DUF2071 family)
MTLSRAGEAIDYRSQRESSGADFHATYRPSGPSFEPIEGTLEHFLTERYCLYNLDHRGKPYRLDIHHPRWPLQLAEASVIRNTMADESGITLSPPPQLLHFAKRQDVVAWLPEAIT